MNLFQGWGQTYDYDCKIYKLEDEFIYADKMREKKRKVQD